MGSIRATIELQDNFTGTLANVINTVNLFVYMMEQMQSVMNEPIDTAPIQGVRDQFNQAALAARELDAAMQNIAVPSLSEAPAPVLPPVAPSFTDLPADIFPSGRAANEAYLQLSQAVEKTERYIGDNVDGQEQFDREIQKSVDDAAGLKSVIAGVAGTFAEMVNPEKVKDWIDDCTAAFDAQLNAEKQLIGALVNMPGEVVVPVGADTGAVHAAYDQITAKAGEIQGQGIYEDEAMITAAAEFSAYFTDTDAIEMMMDTLADYAMGMSGGGEIDSAGMVDYAADLGKVMSGAYDAMTQKGFEFTDAQKAIIAGEATQEQIASALGEEYLNMSSDMQAAAAITQVIDESWGGLYESMSNTPEGKIIQMANAWNEMKEVIGGRLYPYVLLFVDAITENWGTIQTVLDIITIGLEYMLGALSWLVEGAIEFAQFVIDNWGWIGPVIYGIIGALAVYCGWQLLCALAAGDMAAANAVLNAIMAANPIMLVVFAIIALIALFYAAVEAINKFAGTSLSATGIIAGAFAVIGAHIINTFVVPTWNAFAAFANFIGNVCNDPIAAIKVAFYDMCLTVIGYIRGLAAAIETLLNKIPGVTVDITSGLDGFYSELEAARQKVKDESDWVEYVGRMDYIDYTKAASAGYSFGEGIAESIENFNPVSLFGTTGIPSAEDYAGLLKDGGIEGGVEDTAGNTGAIADSMGITEEELKYLHDIAEQEAVNRFTTAKITVEQTNYNNVSSGMDLDGIVSGLDDAVGEAIEIMAEGVHE